jgi:predicted methyltransferase
MKCFHDLTVLGNVLQGSGYLTACFSYATQPGSYVLGVEKYKDVAVNSIQNLNRHNPSLLSKRAIDICAGNIYDVVGALLMNPSSIQNPTVASPLGDVEPLCVKASS